MNLFTPSSNIDDKVVVQVMRLHASGRKARFVVKMLDGHIVGLEARDADPYAAGWTLYGEHRALMEKYMLWIVLGAAPLILMSMFWMGKNKK